MRASLPLAVLLLVSGCIGAGDDSDGGPGGKNGLGGADANNQTDPADPFNATLLRSDVKKFDGSFLAGTQDPLVGVTNCGEVGREGVDQQTFDWNLAAAEGDGTPSSVRFVRIKLAGGSPTTMDIDVLFLGPGGQELGAGTSPLPEETVELVFEGLAAGVYKLRVIGCNLADIKFTLTAQADYHSV